MKKEKYLLVLTNVKIGVLKLLAQSTTHGLPKVIASERITLKIMWTLFFLASSGLCASIIVSQIRSYLDFDVVTKVREVNEFPSPFPTVSICNLNYFTTNEALTFLKNVGLKYNLPDIFNETSNNNINATLLQSLGALYYIYGLGASHGLTRQEKKALGYDISEFMIDCKYVYAPCNLSRFEWFEHFVYGNCFKFNAGVDVVGEPIAVEYASRSSPFEALSLKMFAGVPDKLKLVGQGQLGMVVLIHNSSTSPLTVNGINIKSDCI